MPGNPAKTDDSQGFPAGFEVFASISDPRAGGHTRHHFGGIRVIAFAAVLCGVRSHELMEEFGERQEKWLRQWLELPHGIPCANTFSRVFQAIEPTAFALRHQRPRRPRTTPLPRVGTLGAGPREMAF